MNGKRFCKISSPHIYRALRNLTQSAISILYWEPENLDITPDHVKWMFTNEEKCKELCDLDAFSNRDVTSISFKLFSLSRVRIIVEYFETPLLFLTEFLSDNHKNRQLNISAAAYHLQHSPHCFYYLLLPHTHTRSRIKHSINIFHISSHLAHSITTSSQT